VLIATLAREAQERGCLHGAGLAPLGLDARRVLTVTARNEQALLWAAEEGATCSALGAVVAVLGARETLYGFTASRRLKLRQEASSVPVFVVRFNAGDATAATARWRIAAVPSLGYATPSSALALPGPLRWRVTRERHAGRPPQTLEIECDATHGLRVAAPACDRPAGAQARRGKAA
jgi:protein ImuA